ASAESFVVINGGLAIPISDSKWTDTADPSLKLGVRVGGGRADLAGFLSADFTPGNFDANPAFGDLSGQRYRLLVGVQAWKELVPNMFLGGRFGLGVDIAHASYSATVLGTTFSGSDTNVGFAAEPAGGLWFHVGSAMVGFELGFPIGYHDKTAMPGRGDFTFHYPTAHMALPRPLPL